jgi:transcriptional regulator with XRE-family HTH domain
MNGLLSVTKKSIQKIFIGGCNMTEKPVRKKKNRRCDFKKITKEARILKVLRESRNLSMRMVAKLFNASEATINHAENGRMDLNPKFISDLISIYGYTYEQFELMLNDEIETPEVIRGDCIEIIKRLDQSKLKRVKLILESF